MADSFISLGELIQHFTELIIEIRNNTPEYLELRQKVTELEEIEIKTIKKRAEVSILFNAYKKIIAVSLELRKLITQFGVIVSTYNTIDYAIYFRGTRYYADQLNVNWLSSNGSGLMFNLKKASEDLLAELRNQSQILLLEMFSKHYEIYSGYLAAMYRQQNKHEIGDRGSDINYGHVAEAHEGHLQQHHMELYKMSKNSNFSPNDLLQQRMEEFKQLNAIGQWHESADEVWAHMRDALGYQRGTVAGDALSTQVKQARITRDAEGKIISQNTTLRLSSVANLKMGIRLYSELFDEEKSPQEVATKLALYMSSALDKDSSTVLNRDILPRLFKKDGDIGQYLNKIEQIKDIQLFI